MSKTLKDSTIDDLNKNKMRVAIQHEKFEDNVIIKSPEDFREKKQPENFTIFQEGYDNIRITFRNGIIHIEQNGDNIALTHESIPKIFFEYIKAVKGTDDECEIIKKIAEKITKSFGSSADRKYMLRKIMKLLNREINYESPRIN